MYAIIFTLWNICTFQRGPEHLPASVSVLALAMFLTLAIGTLSIVVSPIASLTLKSIFIAIAQIALAAALVYGLLKFRNSTNRLFKTMSAWYGTEAVVGAFILIVSGVMTSLPIFSLVGFLLFAWQVAIHGFILHRSLTVSFAAGVGIAFGLHLVMGILVYTMFDLELPDLAADATTSPPS